MRLKRVFHGGATNIVNHHQSVSSILALDRVDEEYSGRRLAGDGRRPATHEWHPLSEATNEDLVRGTGFPGKARLDSAHKPSGLQRAAEAGCIPAMYDLAMLCHNPMERKRWLREAARNGWEEAIVQLAATEC